MNMIDLKLSDEISYMSIEELIDSYDSGKIFYTEDVNYIRQNSDLGLCKESITFPYTDDSEDEMVNLAYVQVLDPILFEINGDVKTIVNGNNRIKSLIELYKDLNLELDINYEIEDFKPIPYRVFNRQLNADEWVKYQVSLNDSTQNHDIYEIATSMAKTKLSLELQYLPDGSKVTKEIDERIIQELSQIYKKSSKTISIYLGVLASQSAILKDLIRSGRISIYTASSLLSWCSKMKVSVDSALKNITKFLGDSEANVTQRSITNYFSDIEASKIEAKKVEGGDGVADGGDEGDSGDDEEDDSDDSDEISSINQYATELVDNLKSLEISNLDERLIFPLSEVVKKIIGFIHYSYPYLEIDALTLDIYGKLVDVIGLITIPDDSLDAKTIKNIIKKYRLVDGELSKFIKVKRQTDQSSVPINGD